MGENQSKATRTTQWLALFGSISLFACSKADDAKNEVSDTDALGDVEAELPGGISLGCDEDQELAVQPLLKLSTVQYKNSVKDLLSRYGQSALADSLAPVLARIPADSLGEGFRGEDERIALEHVQGFFDIGLAIGDAVQSSESTLAAIAPGCADQEVIEGACWESLTNGFLKRVYRRPLSTTENTALEVVRDAYPGKGEALRAVIAVALSSPRFLYHVEVNGEDIGQKEDLIQLDAYEVANRLSYTFWQTLPDEELFELAENGSLLEEEVYQQQLVRIFGDPRARETLSQFWNEWLRLEKFTGFESERPGFIALSEGVPIGEEGHDLYGDMVDEVRLLTERFTFEAPSGLTELLLSSESVTGSGDLASLYGVAPWDGSGTPPSFPDGERAGLLQRGALLVSNLEQTNPFHRGALVRRQFLCDALPQPSPNDLPPGALDPPPFDESQTTRERFAAKVDGNGLCEGCHASFSDIGYVMESFDALGRVREKETVFDEQTGELLVELDIDTSGAVSISSFDESPVANATEMNERIAASGKVHSCMAESYFRYAARRAARSQSLDQCVVEDLAEVLGESQGGLAEAFQRVARISTFFVKKVGEQ